MSLIDARPTRSGLIPKALRPLLVAAYCIALLLGLDVLYSNFFYDNDVLARISDLQYHHGLVANFAGHYRDDSSVHSYYTNNLGFRDGAVREVPLIPSTHRELLIGDSFTEAANVAFQDSFAGLLYQAGQERKPKIEFLNAGVASYSPVIYYKKIKALIERGLQFDEVVVFSDVSDVYDEAARAGGSAGNYFCIDDDPRYFAYCRPEDLEFLRQRKSRKTILQRNFVVTGKLVLNVQRGIKRSQGKWISPSKSDILDRFPIGAWTIPGFPIGDYFAPLGVEGGIARSLQNMQKLADVLAKRGIPLTIVVYPWPMQLAKDDRESRQVAIWQEFCNKNCKKFINAFPTFFAEKDGHTDWYERLFNPGDVHFSIGGNKVIFDELARHLL